MDIKEHYRSLFEKYGESPQAVQYTDEASLIKRLEVLLEIDKEIKSVVDVGCGLAHLLKLLKSREFSGKYLGLDFVSEFVKRNREVFKNEKEVMFQEFDLTKDIIPDGYDYIFLSGVFNNKMADSKEFMLKGIKKMFEACSKGVAFNAMTTYVDYQDEHLYYSDPLEIFDFCKKNLTKKVTLRHDYLVKNNTIPFEYAIYLYK